MTPPPDIPKAIRHAVFAFRGEMGQYPTQIYLGFSEYTQLKASTEYAQQAGGQPDPQFDNKRIYVVNEYSHLAVR